MVYRLAADPENPDRIFAATDSGLFVSSNEGKQWSTLPFAGELPGRAIAIDPWKPANLFLGTRGKGLFRSSDGGTSWTAALAGEDPTFSVGDIHDIVVDPAQPDVVYAAAYPLGVMKSTDGGRSWARASPTYSASVGVAVTHLLAHGRIGGHVLIGTNAGGVEKTTDGGALWSPVRSPSEAGRILSLTSDPRSPDFVLAGTEAGILRSTDFGDTWTPAAPGLPSLPTVVTFASGGTGTKLYAFGEGIGVRSSFDRGVSWDPADRGLGGADVRMIVSNRPGDMVYAVVGQTILRYETNTAWRAACTGIRGSTVHALAFDADSSTLLFASTPIGVFRTTDGGVSWRQTSRRLSINPLLLDTHPWIRTRVFASGEQGIFVSTDRGESWGQAKPVGRNFRLRQLTYVPTNAGLIHGATPEGVITTSDGGFTWQTARFGMDSQDVLAVTLDPDNARITYAWTPDGAVFRSFNSGLEWNRYSSPWPDSVRLHVAADRYRPSSAVALVNGTDIYYTATGGGTWRFLQTVSGRLNISALHWNAASGILYAATHDKGVYRMPLGSSIMEADNDARALTKGR
jgi:photosystem II stability/assembly factor-like uncharacterized protein